MRKLSNYTILQPLNCQQTVPIRDKRHMCDVTTKTLSGLFSGLQMLHKPGIRSGNIELMDLIEN